MKKKKLLRIILIPVLMIVFLQGILPFLTLVLSGAKTSLEESMIRMDNHTVENRQVVLENEMVEKWRSIYKESTGLSQILRQILQENDIEIGQFLQSPDGAPGGARF